MSEIMIAAMRGRGTKESYHQNIEILGKAFTNTLTTVEKDNLVIEYE